MDDIAKIERPIPCSELEKDGVICDLLWADPNPSNENGFQPNTHRKCSVFFGPAQVEDFLDSNGLCMMLRAHQVQQKGFSTTANGRCVTLYLSVSEKSPHVDLLRFSAPNYVGRMDNDGAFLNVKIENKNITCKVHVAPLFLKFKETLHFRL